MNTAHYEIAFEVQDSLVFARFKAMANPCLIIVEHHDVANKVIAIQKAMQMMANEVWRIEQKYSRYLETSSLSAINNAKGQAVALDSETYQLLNVAGVLWQESEGMFDISSGVFREIWDFNSQQTIPTKKQVSDILQRIGWQKIQYDEKLICLEKGMQIDFGGIGKEYAADRCAAIAPDFLGNSLLVNLGGDVVAKGPRLDETPWDVGIERKEGAGVVWKNVPLANGAIATSGDIYKSIQFEGKRYSHIINALTGFPALDAPRTVSVVAPNCTEAGMLSTVAMLKGIKAEAFLEEQGRPFWVQR